MSESIPDPFHIEVFKVSEDTTSQGRANWHSAASNEVQGHRKIVMVV